MARIAVGAGELHSDQLFFLVNKLQLACALLLEDCQRRSRVQIVQGIPGRRAGTTLSLSALKLWVKAAREDARILLGLRVGSWHQLSSTEHGLSARRPPATRAQAYRRFVGPGWAEKYIAHSPWKDDRQAQQMLAQRLLLVEKVGIQEQRNLEQMRLLKIQKRIRNGPRTGLSIGSGMLNCVWSNSKSVKRKMLKMPNRHRNVNQRRNEAKGRNCEELENDNCRKGSKRGKRPSVKLA